MSKSKHSEAQIIAALKQMEAGRASEDVARECGVSKHTIYAWKAKCGGLDVREAQEVKQRSRTFKLSRDPKFLEKMTDVEGLCLNPPQQAIVSWRRREEPDSGAGSYAAGLPIKKGRYGTMTHNYKRNGTTTLFAALDTLQGEVVGECQQRHRHQEFLKFLRRLDVEFPGKVPLHLVMDNYGTHKHEKVREWLKRHPWFAVHFVPTSSSWLNLVERWFCHLDQKTIRRGVFLSVADVQLSIDAFLHAWDENPKPFVWTATVESGARSSRLAQSEMSIETLTRL